MKNLSFLKGLVVGIAIATVGGVVYANSISSAADAPYSWATIKNQVYLCRAVSLGLSSKMEATCVKARMPAI
jgi:hypothetical protein